jgi:hypothetical protein
VVFKNTEAQPYRRRHKYVSTINNNCTDMCYGTSIAGCVIVIVALVLPDALQRRHTAVHAHSFLSVDAEVQAFTSSNGGVVGE